MLAKTVTLGTLIKVPYLQIEQGKIDANHSTFEHSETCRIVTPFHEVQFFRALANIVYIWLFSYMDNKIFFNLLLGYFYGFDANVLPFIQQPL